MKLMRWNSIRVRLTLWNVMVLALFLGGFGTALCYRVQADMQASIDRELASRPRFRPREGRRFRGESRGFRGERRGWGERRGLGPDAGPGFERRPSMGPPWGGSGAEGPGDRSRSGTAPRDPFAGWDEATRQRVSIHFPRFLTLDGKPASSRPDQTAFDPKTVAAAAAGREVFSTVQIGGEPVRVLSAPMMEEGRVTGVVQMAHPLTEQQRLVEGQLRTLGTLLPLALLIAGAGGIFLTERALRPVRKITQAAAEIGAEDLSRRLEVGGQDEFAELARTFNGMIARLDEAFRRLERSFEQQKRFTADASHELRTPLTRIKGSVSLALSGQRDAAAYRKTLQIVDAAADVMNRLIQDLLLLARADTAQLRLQLRPLPVAELFEDAVEAVPEDEGCRIRIQLPDEPLHVLGDSGALTRLLGNLIENALRHTPEDGRITLSARREGDTVVLSVEDTGEGIPPEHLPHVTDRFYRVDDARSRSDGGTGLGLAICRSIAEAHGGTLSLESTVGEGTTVHVTLPYPEELETAAREAATVAAGE